MKTNAILMTALAFAVGMIIFKFVEKRMMKKSSYEVEPLA